MALARGLLPPGIVVASFLFLGPGLRLINALDEFNKYIDENGNFKDGVVAAASDINIDPEYFVYANVLNAIGNEFSIRPGMGDNIYDASVNKWYSDTKEAEYKANPEARSA